MNIGLGFRTVIFSLVGAICLHMALRCEAEVLYQEWVKTYHLDPSKTNAAWKILLTSDGVIVGGTSADDVGNLDYFLIKYNPSGVEAWARRYASDTGSQNILRGMSVDESGNVFVTGSSDTVKYDSSGNLQWIDRYSGRAIAVDSNFVYVTGYSTAQFSTAQLTNNSPDGGIGWEQMFDATPDEDISAAVAIAPTGKVLSAGWETTGRTSVNTPINKFLLISYSSDGIPQWQTASESINGFQNRQKISGLEFDSTGSAYLMGSMDEGTPTVMRVDSQGNLLWSHLWTYATLGNSMKVVSVGGVVCVGYNHDGAISKYAASGDREWSQSYSNPSGRASSAVAVDVSREGEVFVAGSTLRTFVENDIFVLHVGPDGTMRSSITFDSPQHGNDVPTGIVVDKFGNVYVTGYSTTVEGGSEFVTIKYSRGGIIQSSLNGSMHVQFPATPGVSYAIEATTDFTTWQGLITNTVDSTGLIQFTDTNAPVIPYRFYRGKGSQ